MTAQFARALTRGRPGSGATTHEPHAALLIDFDNVTMGIRSDLTKELKNLLNSDIIKGKVAVQRAYADWRRYPQYIVPLAESSVDLIFAPAYGSAKKNATDIRLAIDAVELVFTRPEIGTIILLSGDSDFSSLVLKLKEYGKYVIGVGIRESASDLLVQNCDEYYSYSVLTGLTRAGDEGSPVVSEDPWELVEMSLRQMIENNDVMRSDRLKQVLLEMDPSFDEKTLGFQKFNKFLVEAASRGIISLRKQENGQYEVGPPTAEAVESAAQDARGESREGRARRGRRGRGRREERGEPREARAAHGDGHAGAELVPAGVDAGTPAALASEPEVVTDLAADAAAARPPAAPAQAVGTAEPVSPPVTPEAAPARDGASRGAGAAPADLAAAYELLRKATADLVRKSGSSARDSDVKRRMLELQAGWDEATLGFSKFSRFLRQAHDAEVITLRRGENGNYDVVPGNGDGPQVAEDRETRPARRDRGRGRERDAGRRTAASPAAAEAQVPTEGATQVTRPARTQSTDEVSRTPAAEPARAAAATDSGAVQAALGFRRGSRGRRAPAGPPPLLEGQAAAVRRIGAEPAAAAKADVDAAAATPQSKRARPAKKSAAGAARARPADSTEGKTSARPARKPSAAPEKTRAEETKAAARRTPGDGKFDPREFGLPVEAGDVASYIARTYKGVGPKSVQALLGRFGAGHVFEALETRPGEVREVMGPGRGDRLLEAWSRDIEERRSGGSDGDGGPPAETAPGGRTRGGRGGRRPRRGRTADK
jgi:uncharacterized protein (TIGR00288 family)